MGQYYGKWPDPLTSFMCQIAGNGNNSYSLASSKSRPWKWDKLVWLNFFFHSEAFLASCASPSREPGWPKAGKREKHKHHARNHIPCSLPLTPCDATRTTWSSGSWSRNCFMAGPSPEFVLKFFAATTSPIGSRTTTLCPTFLGQCSTPLILIDETPIPPSSSPPSARTSNWTFPGIWQLHITSDFESIETVQGVWSGKARDSRCYTRNVKAADKLMWPCLSNENAIHIKNLLTIK